MVGLLGLRSDPQIVYSWAFLRRGSLRDPRKMQGIQGDSEGSHFWILYGVL